jgi:ParB/RepB/Spo0J family partition protein
MSVSTETVGVSNGSNGKLHKPKKKKKALSESSKASSASEPTPSVASISINPKQASWEYEWYPVTKKGPDGTPEVALIISPRDVIVAPFDARAAEGVITEEFQQSVADNGVHTPILVAPVRLKKDHSEEGYALLAGRRRLRAAREANNDKNRFILARIIPVKDWLEAFDVATNENNHQLPMTNWDKVHMCEQYIAMGLNQQQISKTSHFSNAAISMFTTVLNLPTRIKGFVKAGKLDTSKTRELARLKDPVTGEYLQDEMVSLAQDAVKKGWRSSDIEFHVNKILAKLEAKTKEDKARKRAKTQNGEEVVEKSKKEEVEYKFDRSSIVLLTKRSIHMNLEYQYAKLLKMRRNDYAIEKVRHQEGIIEGLKMAGGLKEIPRVLLTADA